MSRTVTSLLGLEVPDLLLRPALPPRGTRPTAGADGQADGVILGAIDHGRKARIGLQRSFHCSKKSEILMHMPRGHHHRLYWWHRHDGGGGRVGRTVSLGREHGMGHQYSFVHKEGGAKKKKASGRDGEQNHGS